jgi:hypothetical protein
MTMAEKRIPDNLTCSLVVLKGDDTVSRRQRLSRSETENLPFSLSQGSVVLRAIIFRHMRRATASRIQEAREEIVSSLHVTPQIFQKGPVLAKSP